MRALLPLLWLGCTDGTPAEPVPWCDGHVAYDYRPDPVTSFTTFPDDHWTVPDPSAHTGLRVSLWTDETPALRTFPAEYRTLFDEMSTLDGFGLTAGVIFRFDGPVSDRPLEPVLVALTEDGPRPIPVDVEATDDDHTRILIPRVPLPPATQVVAAMLTEPADPACVAPSPTLRMLLTPGSPARLGPRFREGLAALGVPPERVAAMTVFTTQSVFPVADAVADRIASEAPPETADLACVDEGPWRACTGTVAASDYRGPDGVVPDADGEPQSTYDLPFHVWLPPEDTPGPYPLLVCGHGLAGDVGQCLDAVELATTYAAAVLAVDAVEHGAHPAKTEPPLDILAPVQIFGIRLAPMGIDGLRLRDNFRQSAFDRLTVLRALDGLDLSGDGQPDLDLGRVSYMGVSLGGMMGPQLVAQSEVVAAAGLAVAGGRLGAVVQRSDTFGFLIELMRPDGMTDGDLDRGFQVLQTVIDAADPAVWAPRVTTSRVDGRQVHVLLAIAHGDDVVPNVTSDALARSLGVPGVGPEVWPVDEVVFGPGPVSGNLDNGATGGLVQLDRVQAVPDGAWFDANHGNVHSSEQGVRLFSGFLEPVSRGATPVILDVTGR